MDILFKEHVELDSLTGHGASFKVRGVGQKIMADSLGVAVSGMATAGEAGDGVLCGLAAYMKNNQWKRSPIISPRNVFADAECRTVEPDAATHNRLYAFMNDIKRTLSSNGRCGELSK
jgi:hypothetical protein